MDYTRAVPLLRKRIFDSLDKEAKVGVRRLTAKEVAVARSNPRYHPRRPRNPRNPLNESERLISTALTQAGIWHKYEDTFFPTQFDWEGGRETEYGVCPDFRVVACEDWPEQYLEITRTRNGRLQEKRSKIFNAEEIYGIGVVLIARAEIEIIRKNPPAVISFLVPWEQLAVSVLA